MAALPVSIPSTTTPRRPIALTQRRLEANRRNARRSTGPRSANGKAKVARNAIKHGFFVAAQRWSPQQHRDFEETLAGLRDDFQPQGEPEEGCVATMAGAFIRMAAMLRWENLAALKYHRQCEREMNERIAAANPAEAAQLRARRARMRRAGLWRRTIPGPREARAIIRYSGKLDRAIRGAASELEGLKSLRNGRFSSRVKTQKQTHYSASPNSGPEARRRASAQRFDASGLLAEVQKQTHFSASPGSGSEAAEGPPTLPPSINENVKTNPLSSMFTGNRHARRRARALARQGG